MKITVCYEGTKNILVAPFEVGIKHIKVAFSDGTSSKLAQFVKERVIYPADKEASFTPLTPGQRFKHGMIGFFETAGYLILILPFIVMIVDRALNKPRHTNPTDLQTGYTYTCSKNITFTEEEKENAHSLNMKFSHLVTDSQ